MENFQNSNTFALKIFIFLKKNLFIVQLMAKILGLGNVLIDDLYHIPFTSILETLNLPEGSMQLVDESMHIAMKRAFANFPHTRSTGGSAANTIFALSQLAVSTGFIGKTGKDKEADFFADKCQNLQVAAHHIIHPTLPTGIATALISPSGQRTFATYLGAAATLAADDLKEAWFDGYSYLYIEGYLVQNHALFLRALEIAKKKNLRVCLNLSSFNIVKAEHDFFQRILPQVYMVFANETEGEAFAHSNNPDDMLKALADICEVAIVKLGAEGACVRSGSEVVRCRAKKVQTVVDTTGAGDFFAAGFLSAYADNKKLEACLARGVGVAACVVQVMGTTLPDEMWKTLLA